MKRSKTWKKVMTVFNHKGFLLVPQNISLEYFTVSYPYSRHESSFQGNRLPPSMSKGGPSSQQPASVLGAAGTLPAYKAVTLHVPGPPGSSRRPTALKLANPLS